MKGKNNNWLPWFYHTNLLLPANTHTYVYICMLYNIYIYTYIVYMFYSLNMTRGACYHAFDLFLISMCNIPPIRIHFSWMSRFVWSSKHGPIGCDFVLISKRWLLQAMPHLQHWQLSLQGRHKAGDTPDHRCVSMNETMENVIFIPKIIGEDHMILVITV